MVRVSEQCVSLVRENNVNMCPIDGRISDNLKGGHFVTEEAPEYGLFTKSLFALNRERHV